MKLLFTSTFIIINSVVGYSQYSTFYGTYDVNANVNLNQNVNVSGDVNVRKTISSIDYGSLALAESQNERTRLESQIFTNTLEKQHSLEISQNPLKAFDYGIDNSWPVSGKMAKSFGFKKFTYYHKIPHKSLFVVTEGYNYRNESLNGVVTEIELGSPTYMPGLKLKEEQALKTIEGLQKYYGKTEDYTKYLLERFKEGEELKSFGFVHKKDLNKAKVFGQDGFTGTVIFENDYEYVIRDVYSFFAPNGILINSIVNYKGDKDEVTFEEIEGRRYYLKRLINQIIATAKITEVKM